MSGTSLDGVDGVLSRISLDGHTKVLAHASSAFDPALRGPLLELNRSGPDELHRAALAADALTRVYARVVQSLLDAGANPDIAEEARILKSIIYKILIIYRAKS